MKIIEDYNKLANQCNKEMGTNFSIVGSWFIKGETEKSILINQMNFIKFMLNTKKRKR